MAVYSVIGAGSSSNNPIEIRVAYDTEYVTLCWFGKREDAIDDCASGSSIEKYCETIEVTPIGKCDEEKTSSVKSITWTPETGVNVTVYYKIIQYTLKGTEECEDPSSEDTCTISDIWGIIDDGKITVYYQKEIIKDYGEYADVTKEKGSKTENVNCSNPVVTIKDGDCEGSYTYDCNTGCGCLEICDVGTILLFKTIKTTPVEVVNTGEKITITLSYDLVITDENCNKQKTSGNYIYNSEVPKCGDSQECCFDKYVEVQIPKAEIDKIRTKLKIDNTIPIIYQNKTITDGITIEVLQKASTAESCKTDCEYDITYCVYSDNIKVEYETYWGSNIWTGSKIPAIGGRAKISWNFIATYKPKDKDKVLCKEYTQKGKDHDIVEVNPCTDGNGDTTFKGHIYYKKRTEVCPEGGTYVSTSVIDGVTMNHIEYEVTQECKRATGCDCIDSIS